VYIENLRISNFRCFRDVALHLRHPDERKAALKCRNINLLLGDNGAGKSSVLKALALAILGPAIRESGFRPFFLVRRAEQIHKAKIDADAILHGQDFTPKSNRPPLHTRLRAEIYVRGDYESVSSKEMSGRALGAREGLYLENSPAFFLTGYGATRRVEDSGRYSPSEVERQRTLRYQRVAGLFESQVSLVPLITWLPEMRSKNRARFRQIKDLLNALLPHEAEFTGKMLARDFAFLIRGRDVPFAALSDGYRAYIGWICDLLHQIAMTCPKGRKLVDTRGVVVVDEIDLHLHPNWQRSVLKIISETFPKLQFVFTTHSPLVAASLERENIFVMEVGEDGVARVTQYQERIFGASANQTLESPYFGVPSTRAESFLDEVRGLTSKSKTVDPKVAFALMDKISGIESHKTVRSRNFR
jgi:predicted ATP-binding protein involved in virulence